MKNIIFIAPPAAGKGTISDFLVKNYGYVHISTGDLLRDEIASGSLFGQEIEKIIQSGSLVDDEVVIQLVKNKFEELGTHPFILDGFPRTLKQVQELNQMFLEQNISNNIAVYLSVDLDTILKRVMGRIICPKCKKSYSLYNEKLKPIHDNICDQCGSILIKRNDDNEDTFKVRYESFMNETKPILDYYQKQGIFREVDATIPLDVIYETIINEAKND